MRLGLESMCKVHDLHFTINDVYSAFQVRPFDKIFSNSLIVRPVKHPNCECHEYVYMCDMKTFVLDKKCANHDHCVRAHRYLITPWFVSVPSENMSTIFPLALCRFTPQNTKL